MMEEMDESRTIECLRGRLLAERRATRLARHEARIMESKLMELENLLCEETKIKTKAEKKLSLLLNKLKINNVVVDEDLETCGSRVSITTKDTKEHRLRVCKGWISECSEDALSSVTSNSESSRQICSERILNKDDHFDQRNVDSSLEIVSVSDTSSPSEKNDGDKQMRDCSQTVGEALNVLRHARREVERSMERRRMVKARWTQLILS